MKTRFQRLEAILKSGPEPEFPPSNVPGTAQNKSGQRNDGWAVPGTLGRNAGFHPELGIETLYASL